MTADDTVQLDVSVWRGDAGGGRFVRYAVPDRESQTVLDVVTWIQRRLDPTLAYRFSCRVGMCGSCAMTVNGKPRWTCRSHVRKVAATSARSPRMAVSRSDRCATCRSSRTSLAT